jgi:hypothetical protein
VKRLTVLVGRVGTVLMAVGLALLLISLIPTREETYEPYDHTLQTSQFSYSPFQLTLNPQRGIRVRVEADSELKVYILQTNFEYMSNWLSNNAPAGNYSRMWETSMLEAFLGNHSNMISYQRNVTGEVEFEYIPTKVEQAMLIFANYGNTAVACEHQISVVNLVAPSRKMFMTAEIIIPVGLVLSAPWFIYLWKEKQKQQKFHS